MRLSYGKGKKCNVWNAVCEISNHSALWEYLGATKKVHFEKLQRNRSSDCLVQCSETRNAKVATEKAATKEPRLAVEALSLGRLWI